MAFHLFAYAFALRTAVRFITNGLGRVGGRGRVSGRGCSVRRHQVNVAQSFLLSRSLL